MSIKKIEHPTLEQIAKHAKQLDELADRIKELFGTSCTTVAIPS